MNLVSPRCGWLVSGQPATMPNSPDKLAAAPVLRFSEVAGEGERSLLNHRFCLPPGRATAMAAGAMHPGLGALHSVPSPPQPTRGTETDRAPRKKSSDRSPCGGVPAACGSLRTGFRRQQDGLGGCRDAGTANLGRGIRGLSCKLHVSRRRLDK